MFCIHPRSSLLSYVKKLAGQKTRDYRIVVSVEPPYSKTCHLWYFDNDEIRDDVMKSDTSFESRAIVTVSSAPTPAMIQMYRDGGRIRFRVALTKSSKRGISFGSQILRIASEVTGTQ